MGWRGICRIRLILAPCLRTALYNGSVPPKLTAAEARAYLDRWRAVNEAEIAELRATPLENKLEQLAAMMASARAFGWQTHTDAETRAVRARWQKLRRELGK